MTPSRFFRVVGWDEYQHYKDRNPPWIKLHQKLLDNYAYTCLQDASKAHLLGIFLLAARHNNRVPADPVYIGKRISASATVDLQVLVDGGFIEMEEPVVQDASTVLAKCSPETETETELPSNKGPAAFVAEWLAAHPAWAGTVDAMRQGIGMPAGQPATDNDLALGLADLATKANPTPLLFRQLVVTQKRAERRNAEREPAPRPTTVTDDLGRIRPAVREGDTWRFTDAEGGTLRV